MQFCPQVPAPQVSSLRAPARQILRIIAEATPSRARAAVRAGSSLRPLQIFKSSLLPFKAPVQGALPPPVSIPAEALTLVGLTSAVSFICSIDRAAMSVAILPMSVAFDWDDSVKGAVSSAFFAGYMITNLCGGYLATRFSAKGVLAAGVVLWSFFTLATPPAAASGNLTDLLAVRSMMGVGEGVSYPSIQNLVREGVPGAARSRALAFIYSGHQLGTIASYLIAPALIAQLGWQSVFFVFGSLGFVWLLGWTPLVQGNSEREENTTAPKRALGFTLPWKPSPTEAAPLQLGDVPWRKFATSKAFWAIVAAQVTVGIGSCLSFSWLPSFYSEVYHVDVASSAAFCLVPFVTTVVATNAAGWIADGLVNNGVLGKTQTRKVMQTIASLGPAVCLMRLAASAGQEDPSLNGVTDAVLIVTGWLALGGFSAAGYGSNHQELSSRWAGVLFGLSNGLASIAGSASIYATGLVLHQTHDWSLIFGAAAVTYVLGAGVYLAWGSSEEEFE